MTEANPEHHIFLTTPPTTLARFEQRCAGSPGFFWMKTAREPLVDVSLGISQPREGARSFDARPRF